MNQFKTTDTGGMPFVADDLRFMDAIYRQAINDILAGISGTDCILWGCRISNDGTFTNITEGAVWLGGELVHVAARQIAYDATHSIFVNVFDLANPDGYKKFADDNFHDTYIVREGNVFGFADTVFAGAINISTAKRIEIVLKSDECGEFEIAGFTSDKYISVRRLGRAASLYTGHVAFSDATPDTSSSNTAHENSYTRIISNGKTSYINSYLRCDSYDILGGNFSVFYFRVLLFGVSGQKIRGLARYVGSSTYFDVIIDINSGYPSTIQITKADGTTFYGAVEFWFDATILSV